MSATPTSTGPTVDQDSVRGLPVLEPEYTPPGQSPALKRPGPGANSPMKSELAHLMEEPPGGANHGRKASANPAAEGRTHEPLGIDDWQAREFLQAGGWSVIHEKDGERPGVGVHAHRGVLHPDEHVDHKALRPMVEDALGFTFEEVRSVYRQGRLSEPQRELRARIDARLLALSRSGANMSLLGQVLGFKTSHGTLHRFLKNALSRAREENA